MKYSPFLQLKIATFIAVPVFLAGVTAIFLMEQNKKDISDKNPKQELLTNKQDTLKLTLNKKSQVQSITIEHGYGCRWFE